ncbi:MAG: hypothetical protein QOH91_1196 [Mycobacterium sp.]|nr:hypothetical protein [Mycobacterium sp.]
MGSAAGDATGGRIPLGFNSFELAFDITVVLTPLLAACDARPARREVPHQRTTALGVTNGGQA